MLRRPYRGLSLFLVFAAAGCASTPPPPPPSISFETKMSWILRLEDQRVLRDAAAVAIVPPPLTQGRRNVAPPPPPPPDLVRLLGDPEARIRRRAALAVGRVGLVEGVSALVKLMQGDTDPEVKQMAAFGLGLIGDASAVEPLRAALGDPSPMVAGRAAEALGLLGDSASAPAIGKLVAAHLGAATALSPDESRVQIDGGAADAFRLSVFALARLKAFEPLAGAILEQGGQPRVQWWPVAYALQRIEDKRALPTLLILARSASVYTRTFAIKGLGALKDPSAVPLLLPLIDAAHATSATTLEAIHAAGRIGDDRFVAPLMKLLYARGLNPTARAETLLALGDASGAVTPDAFIDFLGDPSPSVRLAALQAIAKRDDESFPIVLSGLDPDPHWSVRAGLATILATKDAERALPRLTPMLTDADARVIPSVLAAMTKLKAPDIGKILIEHLAKDDVGIRAAAAVNLGEVKPDGGVEPLIAAHKRGEADLVIDTRAAAIESLSKYGAVAVPTLRAALADKDWAMQRQGSRTVEDARSDHRNRSAIRPAPVVQGRQLREPGPDHSDGVTACLHRDGEGNDRDRARCARCAADVPTISSRWRAKAILTG